MEKRPIVNTLVDDIYDVHMPHSSYQDVTNATFQIDTFGAGKIHMIVKQKEPHSKCEIQFDENVDGTYYCVPCEDEYNVTTNIINTIQERYEKRVEKIKRKREGDIKKESL